MDKEHYRQVPYRFLSNESNTDACKLEKLTNLFPDMKTTIELGIIYLLFNKNKQKKTFYAFVFYVKELFKINNLSRAIDRLSRVYTVLTALDVRDDTLHLFLGPYHLSLGPALFAAMNFKNASTALLVNAHPTSSVTTDSHRRKRRRELVLRRFRRVVRKLTLVKSIINELRAASILTPYNQYELYKRGIYDLVLAGRKESSNSMFSNDEFMEELENLNAAKSSGERNPLLASNFTKINHLLNLISSSQQQQQQSHILENSMAKTNRQIIEITSQESFMNAANNNDLSSLTDPTSLRDPNTMCCALHRQNSPYFMLPIRSTMSPPTSQIISMGSRSRNNSHSNTHKTVPILSRQSTANSLPESIADDGSNRDLATTTTPPPSPRLFLTATKSNSLEIEVKTPTQLVESNPFGSSSHVFLSSSIINEEDALINSISSLLTSHFLSRQSPSPALTTSSIAHEHETNSNLSDSAISLSTGGTTGAINSSLISNQSSSSIITNEIDKLLQRIKTAVDNRLSIEISSNNRMHQPQSTYQTLTSTPLRTTASNRRQQLLALHAVSCQDRLTDEYDVEQCSLSNSKHKLDYSSKSQSFDATTLNSRDAITTTTTTTTIDTKNNVYEMTTFHSDEKGVQTDPRIRHARSKLLETLQEYVTAVIRFREHLFKQYTQSNTYYEQHYSAMPELQQYEYRDLMNVRKEILNRFEWVINELEQTIENLQARRLSVADAQRSINRPIVKEVIESSLNAEIPPVDEHQASLLNDRQRSMPSEDEWRMYARDLQDTKEDLYFIDSLVHRGISKIDRLVTFSNLYT
ncbi:unnamed protein product [Rotaria magnacalcarata]|uniref:Uncharacterized protein n=3 Tax=Rotaria magnacalcarata TaxID=392030 RepID=A0A816UPJ8_9BILA|nr:unnamed protein product [Rotaria magnacalcarata]CAF3825865.1 unnamed protein product [Rotaria magnacalcarata]